mgnify:CR=1 FL=1
MGSLFKSQNASTWEPSQWEDLKFTLYRADFLTSGTFDLYNADLKTGNNQIPYLNPNALVVNSRKLRVGLGTTVADSAIKVGNTVTQLNSGATGNLVSTAGIATGALSITRPGIGFTPASGHYQYDGVSLTTLSGSGTGAKANITIKNGVALGATFSVGGHGYQVGDVLGITSIGNNNLGLNARLSVATIGDVNELILDNVQGDYKVGAANTIFFTNSAGVSTAFCGPITFIGIAAPHLARFAIGASDHLKVAPLTAIIGASIGLTAEIIAQLPGHNSVLPLNAVTALLGAPVVIWILISHRKTAYV